jgi:hypothetical protein
MHTELCYGNILESGHLEDRKVVEMMTLDGYQENRL